MPKYLDESGLTRFYDNIADRPVHTFDTVAEMQAATYLKDGMTCHTNGFHAAGDGGAAYYTVGTNGTANGMDVLTLQGELFATLVVTGNALNPSQYGGTDSENIQFCIDRLPNGGTIIINRLFTLTDNIVFSINSNQDKPIKFIGIGNDAGFSLNGHSFIGAWDNANKLYPGNVFFSGLNFKGTALNDSNICFDCSTLIRIYVNSCYFSKLQYVFHNTQMGSGRMQTIYVTNCVFRRVGTIFHNYGTLTDVKLESSVIEWGNSVYESNDVDGDRANFVVRDCLIEGMKSDCFVIYRMNSFTFAGNYLEKNVGYIVVNDAVSKHLIIESNYCAPDDASKALVTMTGGGGSAAAILAIIKNNYIRYAAFPVLGFVAVPNGRLRIVVSDNFSASEFYVDGTAYVLENYLNKTLNSINDSLIYLIGDSTIIPSTGDFNNYVTQGVYTYGGNANTSNKPVQVPGLLEVYKSTFVFQRFTTTAGAIYVRSTTNGSTWSNWVQV